MICRPNSDAWVFHMIYRHVVSLPTSLMLTWYSRTCLGRPPSFQDRWSFVTGSVTCTCTIEMHCLLPGISGLSREVVLWQWSLKTSFTVAVPVQWSLRFKTPPFNNSCHFKTSHPATQLSYFQYKYPSIFRQNLI